MNFIELLVGLIIIGAGLWATFVATLPNFTGTVAPLFTALPIVVGAGIVIYVLRGAFKH